MSRRDRIVFRRTVPRAARRAARVLTVSERSRRDLVELYGLPEADRRDAERRRPRFRPGDGGARDYVLAVGAIQPRKNQLAALAAAQEVGLPLVVAGPEKDAATARELRESGADAPRLGLDRGARGALPRRGLPRSGVALRGLRPARAGGDGERNAGRDVRDEALLEVAGDAAVVVAADGLADGIRSALADRDGLAAAGLERARLLVARVGRAHGRGLLGGARTMSVSAVVVSHGHAAELERSLAALVPQVDELVVDRERSGSSARSRRAFA